MRTRSRRTSAASGGPWSVWASSCSSWAVNAGEYKSGAGVSVMEVGRGSVPVASRREQSGAGGAGGVSWESGEANAGSCTARGRSCCGRDPVPVAAPDDQHRVPAARGGHVYVLSPVPTRPTRTVLLRRAAVLLVGESVRTRRQMGGTQTINTRRRGRGGHGYVLIRCPRGGARTVLLRRARWLVGGSVRTRRRAARRRSTPGAGAVGATGTC